jgi:class 3 adenylate cyclase
MSDGIHPPRNSRRSNVEPRERFRLTAVTGRRGGAATPPTLCPRQREQRILAPVRRGRDARRLATVLFIDIVDSTRIAGDIGDRRWRELLREFRRIVRRQLRVHGGQEQDTAGDGFFATFERPAAAVRASAGTIREAQRLGLDVRVGMHFGELERIDGRLGGIAAHIGARVMTLAGPAEALVTSTVRDLVVGGGVSFGHVREAELKGVPGLWSLHLLTSVDGETLPRPLAADAVMARPAFRRATPRRSAIVAGAGLLIVAAGGLAFLLGSGAATPRTSPAASQPLSLVRIDSEANQVAARVHDEHVWLDWVSHLDAVDGTLWQHGLTSLVRRDMRSGAELDVYDHPEEAGHQFDRLVFFGFGSIWQFTAEGLGGAVGQRIDRVSPLSKETLATIPIEQQPVPFGRVTWLEVGRDAIWLLTRNGQVIEVSPAENREIDRDETGIETPTDWMAIVGQHLWICACVEGRIREWDTEEDAAVRDIPIERGFPLSDFRAANQASISLIEDTVWLADLESGTVTPWDTATGQPGRSLGVPPDVRAHAFGLDSLWFAAGPTVHRIDLRARQATAIAMPDGVDAGGIAVDEGSRSIWVSNVLPP